VTFYLNKSFPHRVDIRSRIVLFFFISYRPRKVPYIENDAALVIVLVRIFGPTLPPDTTDAQLYCIYEILNLSAVCVCGGSVGPKTAPNVNTRNSPPPSFLQSVRSY
jgi:hypothetical protein